MSTLIDWAAFARVLGESLIAGVLIVTVFSLGARFATAGSASRAAGRRPIVPWTGAAVCFGITLAGVLYGLYFVIDK